MPACTVVPRLLCYFFIIYITAIVHVDGLFEGDKCTLDDNGDKRDGVCINLRNCEYGRKLLRSGRTPMTCGFVGRDPIVCCMIPKQESAYQCVEQDSCMVIEEKAKKSKRSVEQSSSDKNTTETLEITIRNDGSTTDDTFSTTDIPTTEESIFSTNVKLITASPVTSTTRRIQLFVVGGRISLAKEFPHMAAIGFGNENDIQWQCGGTLISPNHVLTAAHCIKHKSESLGFARWVRLGDLDLKSDTDDADPQTFTISEAIPHPNYSSPSHYDDLAIMRLNGTVRLTDYVKPACLHTDQNAPFEKYTYQATGWGRTSFAGDTSSQLMKVQLKHVNYTRCQDAFKNVDARRLPNGIQKNKHLCAGDVGKDTCQGDSGGPLQIRRGTLKVVGVTSFGKTCGIGNSPGVYVRISKYIDWIKSVLCK